MNWPATYSATLAHYRKLYAIPGWKAHALHQVNLMARQYPDFWRMLPAEVMEGAK